MRKLVILLSLLFTTSVVLSQIKDSISNTSKFQSYTNKNGEIYTYKKPRFFEMITNIPKNVYGTVNDFGYKENLIALGGATVMTVVIIPEDQKLLDQSRILGEQIGLKDFAKYTIRLNLGYLFNWEWHYSVIDEYGVCNFWINK